MLLTLRKICCGDANIPNIADYYVAKKIVLKLNQKNNMSCSEMC